VLQCVAVYFGVLQCIGRWRCDGDVRSVLQCVAVCCSGLQWVAVGCSMLQWVVVCCGVFAVCCGVLQCVSVFGDVLGDGGVLVMCVLCNNV